MKLTTKGRFAVTAMVDLAARPSTAPMTLAEISARQKISLSYLEQLFAKLRRRGIVDSVRGPGGGYRLAKEMEQIAVADIILAVDEPLDATQCGGLENCRDEQKCITHDLWVRLNEYLLDYLGAVTLKQLVDGQLIAQEQRQNPVSALRNMSETTSAQEQVTASV